MLRLTDLKLPLDHASDAIEAAVRDRLGLSANELRAVHVARRAWDARKRSDIFLVYSVDIEVADEAALLRRASGDRTLARTLAPTPDTSYRQVARAPEAGWKRPVVIGTGPCGIFAALILAEMGFRPIILDRGKVVRQRTKDTWGLWRRRVLVPESNVQFGEGGAGTFSDGKLYSGIKAPEAMSRKVLTEFVQAGAPEEILFVAKPHIGTFRLVTMVESMRAKIEALGGEYRFGTKVVDVLVETGRDGARRTRGVVTEAGETIETDHVVLAIGHSARDTFQMLFDRGVHIEAKPFSIGVRIEHPQSIIDRARFGAFRRQQDPRCGRLQAGASRRQRPQRLFLLHVPGRHGGRGRLRTRPRGDQRHEPVFPRRTERQCRHRRRHHARGGLPRPSARRHRAAAALGGTGLHRRRRRLRRAGPARGRFPGRPSVHRTRRPSCHPISRA